MHKRCCEECLFKIYNGLKNIKYNRLNSVVFFVFLTMFSALVAVKTSMAEAKIGFGLLSFDYVEYDDNNVFLDAERGLIPGVILSTRSEAAQSYHEWVASMYYNTIKYDGQTQSGTPLQTISDAFIFDGYFKVGKKFAPAFDRQQSIYVGLGYRYWLRNIRPGFDNSGNPVAGILEEYYWLYGLAGYAVSFDVSKKVNLGFDFRLTRMFNAKMNIDFLGYKNFDNTVVNLGNKTGARLSVPIKISLSNTSFMVTPYYEIIDIGKSNSVRVLSGGAATTTVVHEPKSNTRNIGIEFLWHW